jgi:hypothetical protein
MHTSSRRDTLLSPLGDDRRIRKVLNRRLETRQPAMVLRVALGGRPKP